MTDLPATYTAAEVKVLTADACKFAYALGRKEAGEEIAGALDAEQELLDLLPTDDAAVGEPSRLVVLARSSAFRDAAKIARDTSSQPSPDATSGRTDPGMDSDLPPEPQAGSKRLPDNTGLEEDCGCIYAPGLGDHITMLCREGHMPGGPR